ncbi:glycosyltransferase family 39 protein [Candidatus Poribacteria bacterium]|nr:glycosyltransferase family 39 protein [Candidatus Poribacteria bacterium]MYA56665.1 glycosyltransferase family 39 protein [Candidatus Poribacteria bacterium]
MKTRLILLGLCLFLIAAIPRFLSLEAHWSSDETRWLRRSAQFMSAVKKGAYSETLIAYHPGVTTMWLAGLRTFFTETFVNVENLAYARWFIGIVVWLGIGIACFLLYQLFGKWIVPASFACLAYSPFFLAQTRRVHTDALATTFILLTVVLLLIYCQNRSRHRVLIFAGITFGLALMSKSYALILLLWMPLCLFLFRHQEKRARSFLPDLAVVLCFLNSAAITTLFIWPVFWTLPFGILVVYLFVSTYALSRAVNKKTLSLKSFSFWVSLAALGVTCIRSLQTVWLVFDRVGWAVLTPHEVEHFFLGKVVNDPGWLFYPLVLTIKSTPLMLPLVCFACFFLWKQRKRSKAATLQFKIALILVSGVLLFTVCFSLTDKKFARYLLPVFPLLEILSAIGFVEALRWGGSQIHAHFRQRPGTLKTAFIAISCLVFFFIQVLPVLALRPFYGTYYNLCWKVADLTKIITVNDPSGVYLAAVYMNQKSDAGQIPVQVSDLGSEYFQYYFKGRTYRTDKTRIGAPVILPNTDYEVIYIRDSQIGWVPQEGVKGGTLEHVITINGLNLAWIYRVETEGMR